VNRRPITDKSVGSVPANTIAILRYPMRAGGMLKMVKGLEAVYGPNLVVHAGEDCPEGWMLICATDEES
jgi:hypothetical protein